MGGWRVRRECRSRQGRVVDMLGPSVRWLRDPPPPELWLLLSMSGLSSRSAVVLQSSAVSSDGKTVCAFFSVLLLLVSATSIPSPCFCSSASSRGTPNSISSSLFLTPRPILAISNSKADFRLVGRSLSHGPSYSTCHFHSLARACRAVACRLSSFGSG